MKKGSWIIRNRNEAELHGHAIQQHIFSRKTKYQYVEIFDTFNYGRVLALDGIPQSSSVDEFIYHEAIVHPALCAHPKPQNVLIIGGGEGAVLREVLKYNTVERVIMVDIDGELIDICREYLFDWHQGSFDDPRVDLICEDGRKYLEEASNSFDCVILDLSDPLEESPSTQLFSMEFYSLVKHVLRDSSVVSLQADSGAIAHNETHLRTLRTVKCVFDKVFPYYVYIPIYATLYGFIICGGPKLMLDYLTLIHIDDILKERGVDNLRLIDSQMVRGLFATPPYIKEQMKSSKQQIITDANPLADS